MNNELNITFRNADTSDFESIKKLMIQSLQYHVNLRPDVYKTSEDFFDKNIYRQLLEQRTILVAVCDNNNIVGTVSYTINTVENNIKKSCKSLWIADLIVDNNYRHKGIGNTLFNEIKCIAKENNVSKIELNVDAANISAIAMYKKQGLTPETIKMEYSFDKEE